MASKIKLLRASALDELEHIINDFFAQTAGDVRIEIDLAGGITYANGEYVAPVRINAPHKTRFLSKEEEAAEAVAAKEAETSEEPSDAV